MRQAADNRPRIAASHGVAGRVLRGLYARMEPEAALKLDSPQDAVFRLAEGRIERIDCAPVSAPSCVCHGRGRLEAPTLQTAA